MYKIYCSSKQVSCTRKVSLLKRQNYKSQPQRSAECEQMVNVRNNDLINYFKSYQLYNTCQNWFTSNFQLFWWLFYVSYRHTCKFLQAVIKFLSARQRKFPRIDWLIIYYVIYTRVLAQIQVSKQLYFKTLMFESNQSTMSIQSFSELHRTW